jgi:hypothetical protein
MSLQIDAGSRHDDATIVASDDSFERNGIAFDVSIPKAE